MNYWLVRAKWGVESKKAEFINNDEWINGYDDKYLEIVKRVETEDILLLAEESTVTHLGICVKNYNDGKQLLVDKWRLLNNPIFIPTNEALKIITKINDETLIDAIKFEAFNTLSNMNEIKVKEILIENFTVFKDETLKLNDNLNIVVGENSTGKSHLLKLLYSLTCVINSVNDAYDNFEENIMGYHRFLNTLIKENLTEIFKPDNLGNLVSRNHNYGFIDIIINQCSIEFELNSEGDISDEMSGFNKLPLKFFGNSSVFIPAKEILSFYEGFISLYENRETSFDKIYYNLAKSLGLPALKSIQSYPVEYKLLSKLEEILDAKILLERGRFYLLSKDNHKTEISLVAEGLRKIGMIAQLLANGSLTKNSILFWDEPETNLNPRLIRKMAEVLMELSRAGMQIFIATHSLFLVKEIEILRKKEDKVKYFGLGFDENKEIRVSQSEDFEYLDDIVILDEAFKQNDRFLAKEDD